MDGVHDLGGLVGFGSVEHEPMEPVFHEPWEGRVFGMMGAVSLAGYTSGPSFRHAIERMDGVHYLASSYYEHWLTGLATLLVEHLGIGSPRPRGRLPARSPDRRRPSAARFRP